MNKRLISITIAPILGIVVMLMPILAYTLFLDSNEGTNTLRVGPNGKSYDSTSWETLDEAARTLGKIDTGASPFLINLIQSVLLAVASIMTALVISLVGKRKIKLAVQKTSLTQIKEWQLKGICILKM